jgi:hypothetical protein
MPVLIADERALFESWQFIAVLPVKASEVWHVAIRHGDIQGGVWDEIKHSARVNQ